MPSPLQRRSLTWIVHRVALVVAVLGVAAGPQLAQSASVNVKAEVAHDASILAARIRNDARRGGPSSMTAVKMVKGCCGVQALEIYKRARPGSFARSGVYFLELVTAHGAIQKVAISELTTKRGYKFGEAYDGTPYAIDLGPARGNWSVGVSHAGHPDSRWTTAKVEYHSEEAQLTLAELQAIYAQALGVLTKAENQAPVTKEAYLHPGLPCGLPEHQACEAGGRW